MSKEISLKRFLSEDNFQWLIVVCCQLVFIGFLFPPSLANIRALASIGMVAILILSLLYNGFGETLKKYFQQKELVFLSLFFWIVFFSGIYSDDKENWLNWVRIKLPFIALPLAFASIKQLAEKKFITLLYGFVVIVCVSVVAVLANYFLHYETITESFLRGNAIPMPFSHIRYTLMVAFAFFCCWFLLEKKRFLFSGNEKWVQIFLLIFLFVALHVFSVRSALLALYIGIIFLLLRFIFIQKKFLLGTISLVLIVVVPYTASKFIPSLQNKLEYMHYDMNQFAKGEINNLSDGIRIISMKGGLETAKQNLWLGVGAGDLKTEMNNFYKEKYPQLAESDYKLPHNQLVWTLATTGIIGLALFLFAFSFPLFINGNYKNWLFVILYLILFSSFFTEATFEEQIGTGFYLIFLLVLMNQFRNE